MPAPNVTDRGLRFKEPPPPRQKTDYIVLHHAAASRCTVEDVHRWHLNRDWLGIGYHLFVDKAGLIYAGRSLDSQGAHCKDHNHESVGVCAEGDFSKEQMPARQEHALVTVAAWLLERYPGAKLAAHRDLNATSCPGDHYPLSRIIDAALGRLTPICGPPQVTVEQARAYLARECPGWEDMADGYWLLWPLYPVRPEVALSLSLHETGKFRFSGDVRPDQNNFGGLGATGGGGRGASFPDRQTGREAVVQHLYLYAVGGDLPSGRPLLDPRWEAAKANAGCCPYLEQLAGRWAWPGYDRSRFASLEEAYRAGATYGQVIRDRYLAVLMAEPVPKPPQPEPAEEAIPLVEYKRVVDELEVAREKLARIREIVA
ncbi:MAG: N-acetylmuramoyl-L-alanine amidase [Bacillota bacterium]